MDAIVYQVHVCPALKRRARWKRCGLLLAAAKKKKKKKYTSLHDCSLLCIYDAAEAALDVTVVGLHHACTLHVLCVALRPADHRQSLKNMSFVICSHEILLNVTQDTLRGLYKFSQTAKYSVLASSSIFVSLIYMYVDIFVS